MDKRFKKEYVYGLFFILAIISCGTQKNDPEPLSGQNETTGQVEQKLQPLNDGLYNSRTTAITEAVKMVSPAVVSVNVTKIEKRIWRGDPFLQRFFPEIYRDRVYREKVPSLGSGFIISNDGYVVTNDHVVGHSEKTEITINTSDGNEYPARLIGQDFVSDIALLKIDDHTLPATILGNSNNLVIGEWTIALGNPFGLFKKSKPTVTVGVISAMDRDFGRVEEGRIYQDMIQTDASINTGNSGGPLVNAAGEVIGMNTFIYTGGQYSSGSVGIGFAIPINRIKEIVKGLKENKIDRDFWVGFRYSPINRVVAYELGYPEQEGIFVSNIKRRSPAEKAGLELGDVLIEINGLPVKDEASVKVAMGTEYLKVGDKLNMKVWREGKIKPVNIILEKDINGVSQ
ncbi:MAG: PDZ domain-containing protein [Calditrichaeota bacterium]|nr:MAG: PDZ domain-containing protein [Calditrichota bacterium]MBL1206922.1 PDZ domain-containing protein [Calditrichota bacterium]NOG46749.1 trypsin-like serine protease [Calditrichota bacterium]